MAVVEIKDVVKDYVEDGEVVTHALRGVDLRIEKGEFMAIAGPSGSGKTTLLNLLGALDTPTSGSVRIDGTELAKMKAKALSDLRRDRIGFVFQAYNLFPVLTAAENAEYVLELQGVSAADRHKRVGELFDRLGLKDLADKRPAKMSGGQQQRVAVARAIAAEPAIVLADEPTANLDQENGRALMDMMRELNRDRGITFLFSTHDAMVLERADRVVHLVDGKVATDERSRAA